ncbi:transposase [Candidatus Parcubacteria bacterium]|nr:transposase [Candidatus Parcubacteria bacterium]
MRKIQFADNEYYHIYNRGVDKRDIFLDDEDYLNFLKDLKEFNNNSYHDERLRVLGHSSSLRFKELNFFLNDLERVVDVIAYSLNPNHFHLILKQLRENGIPNFMHKIGTGFTNKFNKKYDRSGSLFQGSYKAIHIDNNNYLLWLAGYVNGNIEIHSSEKAEFYKWSSFKSFLNQETSEILGDIDVILSQFEDAERFKEFIERVISESKTKKEMEKYLLEKI